MISFSPDVILTVAWCVFGIVTDVLPFEFNSFRVLSIALLVLLSRKKMRFSKMHFICIAFCIYYYIVCAFQEGVVDSIGSSISVLSWSVTLLVFSSYCKKQKDLRLIIEFIIFSGLVVSIIFITNNTFFSNSLYVNLNNGNIINRNSIIFSIFPAYLFQLFKIEKTKKKRIIDIILLFFLLFACIQVNSRAMYYSLIISTFLVFNKQIISMIKSGKLIGLILFLIIIGLTIYIIYISLPEEYIARQFNNIQLNGGNNRLYLWKEAIGLVDNPLFGMGPSYYANHVVYSFSEYGSHNFFIDLYVAAGIFSPILFACVLSFFVKKNMYILAIIAPAFITFMVEAGRVFFPYMLLMISWFIVQGAKNCNISIDQFIDEIFNIKKENRAIYENK